MTTGARPSYEPTRDIGPAILAISVGALLLAAVVLIAGYATSWGGHLRLSQRAAPVALVAAPVHSSLALSIVTGTMLGNRALGPAYVPSSFTLPAHATVTVTVTDFDNATPLTGALTRYATVTGTVGDAMQVQPIDLLSPNTPTGAVRTLHGLPPAQVAHTLTIPALGINVPMAGAARITFTLRTGRPGTYAWECMDPCGSGPGGLGGAMGRPGFMAGTITVAA